jgi:hypothetical protein
LQSGRRINMATNNNGHLIDDKGNVVVDFVWGNLPLQPNDDRVEPNLLDWSLDNHIIADSGWGGYPLFTANSAGADVAGATDYILVPSVLGKTTALAIDALEDAGFATKAGVSTVVTGTAATNTASTITAVSRTGTTATVTSTGAGAKYPVGTKVTVASLVSPNTALNGTWTVTVTATDSITFETTTSGALSTTGLSVAGLTGAAGTVKTQTVAAGASNVAPGAAITITPWA